jgi:dynein intermediate chain
MAKITQVDFPPREIVTYTKETQTPVMAQPKEGEYLSLMWLSLRPCVE